MVLGLTTGVGKSGAQLARVQRVHLHPRFFGNSYFASSYCLLVTFRLAKIRKFILVEAFHSIRGAISAGAAGAFAPAVFWKLCICTRGFLETLYLKPRKWRFYISRYTVHKKFAPAVRES